MLVPLCFSFPRRLSKLWLNRFLAFFRVDFGRCWNIHGLCIFSKFCWNPIRKSFQTWNSVRLDQSSTVDGGNPARSPSCRENTIDSYKKFWSLFLVQVFFYINCQCMNHTFQTMTTTGNSLPKSSCHGTSWWHYSFRNAGESCRWDRRPAEHGVKRPLGVTVSTETYQHVINTNIIKS